MTTSVALANNNQVSGLISVLFGRLTVYKIMPGLQALYRIAETTKAPPP